MATAQGTVKKVALSEFSRPRANGIRAIELREGDSLIGVDITNGNEDILLFSDIGKVVRFSEADVRPTGRTACGVRGIRLQTGQKVIALQVVHHEGAILTATENGYGKRTSIDEYRTSGRGGSGVISIQVTERNGKVVSAEQVQDTDDVMLITNRGTLVRTHVSEISVIGRNTQGVRLINLSEEECLIGTSKIAEIDSEEDEQELINDE